jgi:hypothetical protein
LPGAELAIVAEACALIRAVWRGVRPTVSTGAAAPAIDPVRIAALVDAAGATLGASCFPRAVALARIFTRRGIPCELHVGVRRNGPRLESHAWVASSGAVLIGAAGVESYVPFAQLQPGIIDASAGSAGSGR